MSKNYTVVFEDFNNAKKKEPSRQLFYDLDSARGYCCRELNHGGIPKNMLAAIYTVDLGMPMSAVPPKKNRVGEVHRWVNAKFMYYHEHPVKYRKAWVDPWTGKIGKGMY